MPDTSQVKEHMDYLVGQENRWTGGSSGGLRQDQANEAKFPRRRSSPLYPVAWIDHVDQHVHLTKTGSEVSAHWEHERGKRA